MLNNQEIWAKKILALADIEINGTRAWDIKVNNPKFYSRVLVGGSMALGESYMDGWWECQALDQFFTRLFLTRIQEKIGISPSFIFQFIKANIFNLQAITRSFEVGQKHYDLGNDFFVSMLGESMTYSCGYWQHATNVTESEYAKLDLICKKLHLQKGQRILDIGSGFGAFAKYAATNYGVSVVGVTVSKEQKKFSEDLCKGLPVEFRLQDYRTLNEKFDHIVSVGMFEHVGVKNYKIYMEVVKRCLKEDGLFLLHTIGYPLSKTGFDEWMEKYIFPNASLPSLKQISESVEKRFIIEDIHNFGQDYDKTLMAWYQNFNQHWPEFSGKDHYDQRFYRMWKYYLLSCAGSFRSREIQLWQVVLSPHGVRGGYKPVR